MADEVDTRRTITITLPTSVDVWIKALQTLAIALVGLYVLWHNNKPDNPLDLLKQVQGQVGSVDAKADVNSRKLDDVKGHAEQAAEKADKAAVKADAADKKLDTVSRTMLTK